MIATQAIHGVVSSLCRVRRLTLLTAALAAVVGTAVPSVALASSGEPGRTLAAPGATDSAVFAPAAWDGRALGSLARPVFELALSAASCAVRSGAAAHPATLTVIDYSRPSSEPRLWVYDLASHELLYQELVAHGQGSGANLATSFSNAPETHQSSLGLFVTGATYTGKNGYSLRLNGLDQGVNDRALERAIVVHGAAYVDPDVVKTQGRLGRSWGCPAIRPAIAHALIDAIKGGNLLFVYYPDQKWLGTSAYLGGCAAAAAH